MRKIIFVALALFLLHSFILAQNSERKADSLAIIQTVLDYGDGFYSGDPERMVRAIHPDMNKIYPAVLGQTGKTLLNYSSYSALIELTRAKVGLTDESKRKIDITVLAINEDIACAKLISSQFNDYLALVKMEGQWKIINVLWTLGVDSPERSKNSEFDISKEKNLIIAAVDDYVQGIYTADVNRVEQAIHPEFNRAMMVKLPQTGKTIINKNKYSSIIEVTRAKLGFLEKEKWNYKTHLLDAADNLAFVEVLTDKSGQYMQLVKIDGQWKIINVLFKTKPKK